MSFSVKKAPIVVAIIDAGNATIIGSTIASLANIVSFTIDVFPTVPCKVAGLKLLFHG